MVLSFEVNFQPLKAIFNIVLFFAHLAFLVIIFIRFPKAMTSSILLLLVIWYLKTPYLSQLSEIRRLTDTPQKQLILKSTYNNPQQRPSQQLQALKNLQEEANIQIDNSYSFAGTNKINFAKSKHSSSSRAHQKLPSSNKNNVNPFHCSP